MIKDVPSADGASIACVIAAIHRNTLPGDYADPPHVRRGRRGSTAIGHRRFSGARHSIRCLTPPLWSRAIGGWRAPLAFGTQSAVVPGSVAQHLRSSGSEGDVARRGTFIVAATSAAIAAANDNLQRRCPSGGMLGVNARAGFGRLSVTVHACNHHRPKWRGVPQPSGWPSGRGFRAPVDLSMVYP